MIKTKGKDKTDIKETVDYSIKKWTRSVINDISKGRKYLFHKDLIINVLYRPFVKKKVLSARI
ncbi:MAG: hypothetical protein IPL12_09460 [Bacteroidetes bacterium]|nr:hypothetical protein [Bacteroidota bacterium]